MLRTLTQAECLGLDSLKVEAAEYAILQLKGCVPESIQEGWKYAVEVFSQRKDISTLGNQTLKCIWKVTCIEKIMRWNSGYQLKNKLLFGLKVSWRAYEVY
jgi:hypothetical protein